MIKMLEWKYNDRHQATQDEMDVQLQQQSKQNKGKDNKKIRKQICRVK